VTLVLATFGVGFASALIPFVNMEAYLVGVGIDVDEFTWASVALGVVAAAGQTVGKAVWYELGRRSMSWSWMRRRMNKPAWRQRYEKVRLRVADRAWVGAVLVLTSAVTGFPPLAIMAVLSGQLELDRRVFYAATFVGRSVRFVGLLGGATLLAPLNPWK
jgi:membrane protein YqaA with SNARE-associated domain